MFTIDAPSVQILCYDMFFIQITCLFTVEILQKYACKQVSPSYTFSRVFPCVLQPGQPHSTNVQCPDVTGRDSWDLDVSLHRQNSPYKVGLLTIICKSDYVLVKTACPMEEVVVVVAAIVGDRVGWGKLILSHKQLQIDRSFLHSVNI